MAKLISGKLPASTLIEVLISMVIIMAVFVVGIAVFARVTQSGFSMSRTEAQQQMHKIIQESIANNDWEEQQVIQDSILYVKSVNEYSGYPDLLVIEVNAMQQERNIGTLRQLVRKSNHELEQNSK